MSIINKKYYKINVIANGDYKKTLSVIDLLFEQRKQVAKEILNNFDNIELHDLLKYLNNKIKDLLCLD